MSTRASLDGAVAIVTGASRGIGLAVARRLVDDGARVVMTARRQATLDEVVASFPPGTAIGIAGSADSPEHRQEVLNRVASEHGKVDILANIAGMNPFYGQLLELELPSARKIFEINVLAVLGWIQDLHRHPALAFGERGGNVVTLSSVTAQTPSEGIGFYGVSKAALIQLTRTLAVELGPRVRVNSIAPAIVKTDFSRALYEGREEDLVATYPLGRLGTPDDVAAAIAFLVSDDASWITGQVLTLDGGLLAAGGRV